MVKNNDEKLNVTVEIDLVPKSVAVFVTPSSPKPHGVRATTP